MLLRRKMVILLLKQVSLVKNEALCPLLAFEPMLYS